MTTPVTVTVTRKSHFWIGFLAGMAVMAAADYGDIWFCMGECGDIPARIWAEPKQ